MHLFFDTFNASAFILYAFSSKSNRFVHAKIDLIRCSHKSCPKTIVTGGEQMAPHKLLPRTPQCVSYMRHFTAIFLLGDFEQAANSTIS